MFLFIVSFTSVVNKQPNTMPICT